MEGLFIEMRPGVVEHAGRPRRVELLLVEGARIGHVRLDGERWRWVVYPDTTGDEATQRMAARMAQFCWSMRWVAQQKPAVREGAVQALHVRGDSLTPAERAERAAEATAWAMARGAEREQLYAAYVARWGA